jgi:hypothetical protein
MFLRWVGGAPLEMLAAAPPCTITNMETIARKSTRGPIVKLLILSLS